MCSRTVTWTNTIRKRVRSSASESQVRFWGGKVKTVGLVEALTVLPPSACFCHGNPHFCLYNFFYLHRNSTQIGERYAGGHFCDLLPISVAALLLFSGMVFIRFAVSSPPIFLRIPQRNTLDVRSSERRPAGDLTTQTTSSSNAGKRKQNKTKKQDKHVPAHPSSWSGEMPLCKCWYLLPVACLFGVPLVALSLGFFPVLVELARFFPVCEPSTL